MVFTPVVTETQFKFKVAASKKVFSIPLRQHLPVKVARAMRRKALELVPYLDTKTGKLKAEPPLELMQELEAFQEQIFSKYAPGVEDIATEGELEQVWNEWARLSDEHITLGE